MSYYSTQSGINQPGNFGISVTYNPSSISNTCTYPSGYNSTNSFGLVPQQSNVNTTSNVFAVLSQPSYLNGVTVVNMNNLVDNGVTSYNTVNSVQSVVNTNVGSVSKFDTNLIAQGNITIGIYKNNPFGIYQN